MGFGRDLDEVVYVEADACDAKSDLWSFGCIVYSVLTQLVLTHTNDIDLGRVEGPF